MHAALLLAALVATALPPPGGDGVYGPPAKPLDPRIAAPAKITENDPPPLPEQVILPLPPDHQLAPSAEAASMGEAHWARAQAALARGAAFLKGAQHESGGWMVDALAAPTDQPERPAGIAVAVTALAIKALVQADPEAARSPEVAAAVRFIMKARRDDGSFEGGSLTSYVTSVVVSALAGMDEVRFREARLGGANWLRSAQWDQTEGLSARQDWFGGAGYGNRERPDVSNTQMMLEALYDAGMSPDEPAFQKALAFMTRAQNLRATNSSTWAGDDGGFVYTPAGGGESMASEHAGEGRFGELREEGAARSLRSYGSMTYAGFKSYLYAGLSPDDVRVRAAFDWIRRHWTFDENPGLGRQGLYYYYHALARALRVAQQERITDAAGVAHAWREELIDALAARQREDGSWKNDEDRWLEGEPVMASVYALLALEEAMKAAPGEGE